MKRLLLALVCSAVWTLSAAQSLLDERLSLELRGETLVEALVLLDSLSAAELAFSEDFLPPRTYHLQFLNRRLGSILRRLLEGTGLQFFEKGTRVFITPNWGMRDSLETQRFVLSGYLRDATNGEELIGGTVFVLPTGQGTSSNAYGFYSLTLPAGTYQLEFSYVGYGTEHREITLDRDLQLDIRLQPHERQLQPVVVVASRDGLAQTPTQSYGDSQVMEALPDMPRLLGETDLFQLLQSFPGINAIGEGSGNLSVRGANGDHTLILLDEAPVYNPAHFLGIFSIFNADAVKAVELQRGYISPAHRGRLASVLSIRMREGSTEEHDFAAGIGLLSARARAEGPLFGGRGSFMVAARRTYPDLLVKLFSSNPIQEGLIFFYDINAKGNYRLDRKNRLFLSTYLGRDVFDFGENFTINWGNQTLTLRWNHLFNDRLFSNTSLILSDFDYRSSTDLGELVNDGNFNPFTLRTRIQDANLKQDFHFYPHPDHTFRFGWSFINHNFIPGRLKNELEPLPELDNTPERRALESGLYFSHTWQLSRRLRLEYGFHLSGLGVFGSNGWVYDYADGEKVDSFWVAKDETLQRWGGVEPRLLLRYRPTSTRTFTLAASRTIQYLQLLPSAFINNPASVWLPSSNNIPPQKGLQLSLGFVQEFGQRRWLLSLDAYLNHFEDQIAYRDGARLLTGLELESQLIFGSADFQGLEVLLQKREGRLRGWLSYALSRAVYRFPDAGDGAPFPGDQHRPHAVNATLLFDLKPHCTLSAAWRYLSGKPVTVPAGKYRFNDQVLDFFSGRNNFTTSNHHRLDIGLRWWKIGKRGARKTWSLSIFNVYGRRNPSFVYFEPREQGNQAYEISLLGWLPSFSWEIQF